MPDRILEQELVLRATNDLELFGKLSYKLLQNVQNECSFDGNPIYAIMQEACYCQGYVVCPIYRRFLWAEWDYLISVGPQIGAPHEWLPKSSGSLGIRSRICRTQNPYISLGKWYGLPDHYYDR